MAGERERGSELEADSFRNHGSTFLKGKLEEYFVVNDSVLASSQRCRSLVLKAQREKGKPHTQQTTMCTSVHIALSLSLPFSELIGVLCI